jgi:hypothetical protein
MRLRDDSGAVTSSERSSSTNEIRSKTGAGGVARVDWTIEIPRE